MLQTVNAPSYPYWPSWQPATDEVPRPQQEPVVSSSDGLSWQNVRLLHVQNSFAELREQVSDQHCIVLNLGLPLTLTARFAKHHYEGQVNSLDVAILPAGTSWSLPEENSGAGNVLLLFLRPLFVRHAVKDFEPSFKELKVTPQIGFHCQNIRLLAMSLLGELNEVNSTSRLYADSLAVALAMQVARHYSQLKDLHLGHGGMAPRRLRKAMGLIDDHVAAEKEGRVALRCVAREVGMSYFHFSRAFKQSMGVTPTNYIAERRIERAKKLMRETDSPISEIALRSGFSSQSHFTTCFRRVAGITPRTFRKGV
jgi:AraC family transcriptional regulator